MAKRNPIDSSDDIFLFIRAKLPCVGSDRGAFFEIHQTDDLNGTDFEDHASLLGEIEVVSVLGKPAYSVTAFPAGEPAGRWLGALSMDLDPATLFRRATDLILEAKAREGK